MIRTLQVVMLMMMVMMEFYIGNGYEDADDSDSVAYGEYMGADEDSFLVLI